MNKTNNLQNFAGVSFNFEGCARTYTVKNKVFSFASNQTLFVTVSKHIYVFVF